MLTCTWPSTCLYNHRENALHRAVLKMVFANSITSQNFEESSFKMDMSKKEKSKSHMFQYIQV